MKHESIWLAQCLCPERHTIIACCGEASSMADAQVKILEPLRINIGIALAEGHINPWCGLCHAKAEVWQYEVGLTSFQSMAEAEPVLRRLERKNLETAALWGDMPRSD